MQIQKNISLKPYTTINTGGCASFFSICKKENELLDLLKWCKDKTLDFFILGSGSNTLISDNGFKGLVIKNEINGIEANKDLIYTNSGVIWDEFVEFCVDNGYSGIEYLSGIPGTIGGGVVQNIGAYGQEISEVVEEVRVLETKSLTISEIDKDKCKFDYRNSIFKNNTSKIVLGTTFKLKKTYEAGPPKYKFNEKVPKDLKGVRKLVIKTRKDKSTYYDKSDPNSISLGSFFKNPIISNTKKEALLEKFNTMPFWELGNNAKLSAGWLIENSGYKKGFVKGNAGLSEKHCLIIKNNDNANSQEILVLAEEIRQGVFENFEILLEPEPVFLGFDKKPL